MIEITARLLPSTMVSEMIEQTFKEFERCCLWVHERAGASILDVRALKKGFYNPLRHQTELGGTICDLVFSMVASYRKATTDMASVKGDICPQKLIYYKTGLSIKEREVSLLLLSGREKVGFDLPNPEDYQVLKQSILQRADLHRSESGRWQLDLTLTPTHIKYTPEGVSPVLI